jgi:aryl-alcohol dehydrogenase-like predicted oxidoreductase
MYGCSENERLVRRAIKDRRDEVILATKLGNVRDQRGNPRPGVEIQSVDLLCGKDRNRGVPMLLAVTAAAAHRTAGQVFSTH